MEISVVHRRGANLQFTKNRWQGHAFWLPADTLVASDFHDDFQCFGYTNEPVFYSTASADRSGSYRNNQIAPPKRSQKWSQGLPTLYFLLRKTCNAVIMYDAANRSIR